MEKIKRKSIPKKTRMKVYDKCGGRCAYCGRQIEYKEMQVDHVVSLYWHKGTEDIKNYLPACRMCNFYKSTYTLEKFRNQIETLFERLEKIYIYRLAKNYGLIQESRRPIEFYFEKLMKEGET